MSAEKQARDDRKIVLIAAELGDAQVRVSVDRLRECAWQTHCVVVLPKDSLKEMCPFCKYDAPSAVYTLSYTRDSITGDGACKVTRDRSAMLKALNQEKPWLKKK